jgi:hypothetical protein
MWRGYIPKIQVRISTILYSIQSVTIEAGSSRKKFEAGSGLKYFIATLSTALYFLYCTSLLDISQAENIVNIS